MASGHKTNISDLDHRASKATGDQCFSNIPLLVLACRLCLYSCLESVMGVALIQSSFAYHLAGVFEGPIDDGPVLCNTMFCMFCCANQIPIVYK